MIFCVFLVLFFLLFFILCLTNIIKLPLFLYSNFSETIQLVLSFYRKKKYARFFFDFCVQYIIDKYSEQQLVAFFVILNVCLKTLMCVIMVFNYNIYGTIFSYVIFLVVFFLILFYLILWELSYFCYCQSQMAAEEFDFFEFEKEQDGKRYYNKVDIELFDYEKFHNTGNFFQLKKEREDDYIEVSNSKYKLLINRLTFFPIYYKKIFNAFEGYKKANLFINILICIIMIIVIIN